MSIFRDSIPSSKRSDSALHELVYLVPPLLAALGVYVAYLLTHSYPGLGAGLFSLMAEAISAHGYALPTTIPYYTASGIPFAYPPLFLYVYAALLDITGWGPLTITEFVPGLYIFGVVVATYALGRELLSTRLQASVAAVGMATSPAVFRMLLSAGGIVRAPAFAVMMAGLAVGVKLFRSHRPRWLVAGVVCFALTVLSHPVSAAFLGFSYLVFFAVFDRSPRGFGYGAVVAVAGLALVSPWLLTVVSRHGIDVFLQASSTHGGLGLKPFQLVVFWYNPKFAFPSLWVVFVLVGGCYLLVDRSSPLLVWFGLSLLFFPRRVTMVVGILIAAVGVCRAARATDRLRNRVSPSIPFRPATVMVVVLCLYAAGTGSVYAANYPGIDGPSATQAYVDGDEVAAMEWAANNTPPNASFAVVGDTAEWFPLFAKRTSVLTYRGAEWLDGESQGDRMRTIAAVATCDDAACLTRELAADDLSPDYLYLSADAYSANYAVRDQSTAMHSSLVRSERYHIVFENEAAYVVSVDD